jgi:hypothetical protein
LGPPATPRADDVVYTPTWNAVDAGFFPLVPTEAPQPILTAAQVTDASAYFVADPFLFRTPDLWYLFFEVTVPQGRIAVATSPDAEDWTYHRIVLREPFQLSYPHVFEADGAYWMTPESASQLSVRLYRADIFPDGWVHVADLVTGRPFADPTVFRWDNRWWMFVGNGASDTCWLFSSRLLDSEWVEHPMSPIVLNDRGRARPAGRAVTLSGNRLYRLAQNSSVNYGRAARAFQVDILTTEAYAEHEIPESPLVEASGEGWNSDGMHQVDPWWNGDHWLAVTDGINHGTWSIGMYRTLATPSAAEAGGGFMPRLMVAPNPSRGETSIHWSGWNAPVELRIYTPAGRTLVRRLLPASALSSRWDGTDASGRQLPAGVYFCRVSDGARETTSRVVLLH